MVEAAGISPLLTGAGAAVPAPTADPAKIAQAAHQFEALLLEQVLQSAKGSGGWLGSDGDSSEDATTGLAEQQLAMAMAQGGGFGLAKTIAKGLEKQ